MNQNTRTPATSAPECGKDFARRDHLLRHQNNCHGDGLRSCSYCPRRVRQDYLTQHELNCQRKQKLPGEAVAFVHAGSMKTIVTAQAHDAVALQEGLEATATPNRNVRSQTMTPTLPTGPIGNDDRDSIQQFSNTSTIKIQPWIMRRTPSCTEFASPKVGSMQQPCLMHRHVKQTLDWIQFY